MCHGLGIERELEERQVMVSTEETFRLSAASLSTITITISLFENP